MTRPTFQWQISLGHVIQIAMLVAAAGIGWATFDARITANEKSVVRAVDVQGQMEGRLRALETATARSDERLTSILNMLARIDARLERIERSGD
jgi:hypothetical protein